MNHTQVSQDNFSGSPVGHQTVLLSATISKGVEDLSELSLKDPVHIDIGNFFTAFLGHSHNITNMFH